MPLKLSPVGMKTRNEGHNRGCIQIIKKSTTSGVECKYVIANDKKPSISNLPMDTYNSLLLKKIMRKADDTDSAGLVDKVSSRNHPSYIGLRWKSSKGSR